MLIDTEFVCKTQRRHIFPLWVMSKGEEEVAKSRFLQPHVTMCKEACLDEDTASGSILIIQPSGVWDVNACLLKVSTAYHPSLQYPKSIPVWQGSTYCFVLGIVSNTLNPPFRYGVSLRRLGYLSY